MMHVPLGDTYEILFTTRRFSTGAPYTLAGTPVVSVYEEANVTQITSGVSLSADYDSVTGLNQLSIVASTGNGYEVGKYYSAVITTGTVDSVSVVGEVVGHFRVMPAEDAGAGIVDVNVTHVGDSAQDVATATALTTVDTVVDNLNLGIIYGSAVTGTLSATQCTSDLSGYADDQLIGRVIIFTSGAADGEATDITDYANTSGLLTFTALTTAPGNGDTFKIV